MIQQDRIKFYLTIKMPTTTVIIPAAGTSNRMGFNKLLAELAGKPVIALTIDRISKLEIVDEIILSVSEEIERKIHEIIKKYDLKKIAKVVRGGSTRVESVWNALQAVKKNCKIVSIHDAARPFVSDEAFFKSVEAAESFGGSVVCSPVSSTIKESGTDFFVKRTIDRNSLWAAATPQSFKFREFFDAFEKTINSKLDFETITDDAQIFELAEKKVKIIEGNLENIKLTSPLDWKLAKFIAEDYQ